MHECSVRPAPRLSVVVVVVEGTASLARCLGALAAQTADAEVLVVCDSRTTDVPQLRGQFPGVRFLRLAGACTFAELRAHGVREARGSIVALTEDHCTPAADWCDRIIEAHQAAHAAVGGAVEKGPDKALNWAIYLLDYSRYMNPVREGPTSSLTDCNVTYKREALAAVMPCWERAFHENVVHAALRQGDETLWLSPRIVVQQRREFRLGAALRDRFAFGKLFGGTRAATLSPGRRLAFAVMAVFLPALLVVRAARHVAGKRRCLPEFVKALPFIVLMAAAWALGEFVGNLAGHPDTATVAGISTSTRQTEMPASVAD
jgi:hypothetical protein